jgi:hypothetical protein
VHHHAATDAVTPSILPALPSPGPWVDVACSATDDEPVGAGPVCMSVGYYRYTLNSYRGAPGFILVQEHAPAP